MHGVTRAEVQRWIESNRILLNGAPCRAKDKVRAGTLVEVRPDAPQASDAEPDASIVLDVVYEDAHLLVVNKPAGLVVHPGRGHRSGTLVNGLLARPGFERVPSDPRDPSGHLRPGIVHRIDKDTSGLLVVAKEKLTRESLKEQLAEHSVERLYEAITLGVPASMTLRTLHGRDPRSRLRFSSKVSRGKDAVTHIQVKEELAQGRAALVQCRLETGRTHQIRVHLSLEARTPLLADALYGGSMKGDETIQAISTVLGRHALHARVLGFVHPATREVLRFEASLPSDMQGALDALRALN
jgi:23S rRNA pseudouridine1911/1915/1917 synthase